VDATSALAKKTVSDLRSWGGGGGAKRSVHTSSRKTSGRHLRLRDKKVIPAGEHRMV